MSQPTSLPASAFLVGGGMLLGMASWWVCVLVSPRFEPYDSGSGFIANQLLLVGGTLWVAMRWRLLSALLMLTGAYLGMNIYSYAFGGAEQRAWAALGAITSVTLLVAPTLLALIVAAVRSRYRR